MHSISRLLENLNSGGNSVAEHELWNRCWNELVRKVACRLNRKYCGAADEEDVALSAMTSFFKGVAEQRFPRLDDRQSFWSLLLTIAYRKVTKHRRRETSQKRDVNRRHSARYSPSELAIDPLVHVADDSVTDEQLALAVEEMTNELGDEMLTRIAILKLQGHTDREVASALGVTERTISRKRERIKSIWNEFAST